MKLISGSILFKARTTLFVQSGFLHNFLRQLYGRPLKAVTHCCGDLSSIKLNSTYEDENQHLESPAELLLENRAEFYFASKFKESRRCLRRKLSF